MSTVTEPLLTAEQYLVLPDAGRQKELVRGKVVEMDPPVPRHGYHTTAVVMGLRRLAVANVLARVVCSRSLLVTRRDPDSVRRPAVCYFRHDQVPDTPHAERYLSAVPDLIVEIRSPAAHWGRVLGRVGEYLHAGVLVVCVLDPQTRSLVVYHAHEPQRVLTAEEELTLPDTFGPEFRIPVRRFFA
jgi:Uma2 family endonuclease